MASKKVNAELTNAERVRNNQRRSRTRRKEYIAELEAKIKQYESDHDQNPTKLRIEGLAKELDALKKLLHALGLDEEFLEAHGKAARLASTWAQDKQSPEETNDTPFSLPQPTSQCTNELQAHPDPILQMLLLGLPLFYSAQLEHETARYNILGDEIPSKTLQRSRHKEGRRMPQIGDVQEANADADQHALRDVQLPDAGGEGCAEEAG
ncbi:hypothetical protein DDE82_008793 [Stemphylium lycopersici]|uniref:BZIP domain-containing protein n=1 Tax=Stemphylium lycopersici TaxID=183478 RepID=A0A364MTF7_STELY|nr:hypothetical protein TW65_08607 [Stemphylium lycopersici]RAQ98901.1 hypothetical protein DDE82_008793 [Stemphylium lycopersici]RAR02094.1 hypothetical protein DDE83_008688 [Stemphylium lycopersici]